MCASPRFSPAPPLGGRYALRRPLGEGAFAVTYLADDLILGRSVAVKLLRSRYGSDPAAAARFEREARAAAAVSSPYIVDVFDYGTDQGTAYIVLQYVAGPTLRELLDRRGRLEPGEAVRLATEILRGLEAIHRAGIVHRDVKPHNVLLDNHGTAHVTDFGVALWSGSETLTTRGLAVGTAAYMAPEQAQATDDVGTAADLYAVGVLLYEMLTGRQPFHADTPAALMLAHVQRKPPLPTEALPGLVIPIALEREVIQALAKRPADRRRSASEMADALAASTADPGLVAPTATSHIATTTSMPAVVGPVAQSTRADTTAVPAPRSGARPLRTRAWLGPLALVLVAIVLLMLIVVRGGFTGFTGVGNTNDPGGDGLVAIDDPSPAPTVTGSVAATATPAGSDDGLFSAVDSGDLSDPLPTISPASESLALTPTPVPTAIPTAAVEPGPTQRSVAVSDEPNEARERRRDRRNRDEDSAQEPEQNPDSSVAPATVDGPTIQFGAGDWQGAAPVEPGSFGRPAVALYGADGRFGRAVLQFELVDPPSGQMVLTIEGLGDETGVPFPFGIEINGMFAGSSTATFDNWHPAEDGLNGEHATWDQVRFTLPPEVFHVGPNEIAIVSLSPGDYDDRPPYLILGDATLALE